jgi:hypothetical protein
MHHFALVVTWTLPDDVTAYSGVSAEVIAQAASVGQVVDQAERLHLEPGDRVVITIKPDQVDSDDDLQRWTDIAREAFPGREIVVAWEGTTFTGQPADGEVSA